MPRGSKGTTHAECHPERPNYGYKLCRACWSKQWHDQMSQEKREARRNTYLSYQRKLYSDALIAYGGVCQCCGEAELKFLQLDHINNDGNVHRRELTGRNSAGSTDIYLWCRRNNYPPILQVLCANCHQAKTRGGCPHASAS